MISYRRLRIGLSLRLDMGGRSLGIGFFFGSGGAIEFPDLLIVPVAPLDVGHSLSNSGNRIGTRRAGWT